MEKNLYLLYYPLLLPMVLLQPCTFLYLHTCANVWTHTSICVLISSKMKRQRFEVKYKMTSAQDLQFLGLLKVLSFPSQLLQNSPSLLLSFTHLTKFFSSTSIRSSEIFKRPEAQHVLANATKGLVCSSKFCSIAVGSGLRPSLGGGLKDLTYHEQAVVRLQGSEESRTWGRGCCAAGPPGSASLGPWLLGWGGQL